MLFWFWRLCWWRPVDSFEIDAELQPLTLAAQSEVEEVTPVSAAGKACCCNEDEWEEAR